MKTPGFTLFDTPIGRCGIAWTRRGVAAVQLPEPRDDLIRARLRRQLPEAHETAPPAGVQRVVDAIVALFGRNGGNGGAGADLREVPLDYAGVPPFHRRVYETVRGIPPGDTLAYGEVALLAGAPGAARAVGTALARNPFAIIVPCHRVVAAGGRIGGFSARGGVDTKLRMLAAEGAAVGR